MTQTGMDKKNSSVNAVTGGALEMLERAVKPINKRRDTACARNKYTTFLKHNVMTIFVILKSGTKYTRGGGGGGGGFSSVESSFF